MNAIPMRCAAIFAAALAVLAAPAIAQDEAEAEAPATIGPIVLEASFADDPHMFTVFSGGPISAKDMVPGCSGYISQAPDLLLTFTADPNPGAFPLFIHALSEGDTTIVVKAPDGNWYCNDDGINGMNPMAVFGPAMSGDYEIWVGSYEEGEDHQAIVAISELGPDLAPLEAALGAAPGR